MSEILANRYQQFKEENPKIRIRDAAHQLGVTELAFRICRTGG